MENLKAEVNLPESFLNMLKLKKEDLDQFIRHSLAVELYREGRISLGKAAEVAGVKTKWEMLLLLNERGVPIDYTAEDAEKDLKNLQEILHTVP